MSSKTISASAKGASLLILLQVGSRALTFALNQILLRFISPELLGISTQLELYSISVIYFSRESLRVTVQRQPHNVQAVVNLSYLAILLGVPLAYFLGYLYLKSDVPVVPYFRHSLILYGLASILELLSEPGFVAAQQKQLYKVRASAETVATISKCLVTCSSVIWASTKGMHLGALPFALGQMSYAFMLFSIYMVKAYSLASKEGFSIFPSALAPDISTYTPYFDRSLLNLNLSLSLQSSLKYILTQGDSLLIATLASLRDQGAYALASNYGGLIARMLFQPIEESSRNLFANLCARDPASKQRSKDNIKQANVILSDILRLYHLISLVACALGPAIAPLLLKVVAGAKWADTGAGDVLATYCYYIPLLALNGVTEAFVAAVATTANLHVQSMYMGGFFIGFAGSAFFFLRVLEMGAQGLVYANCVNMLLRVVWNIGFVKDFFATNSQPFLYSHTLPTAPSIAATVAVAGILASPVIDLARFSLLGQLVRAGGIAAGFGLVLLVAERRFFVHCYEMVVARRPSKTAADFYEKSD
ncbi:Rft-1-domain-containing protein [Aulographum hederae CBS 113979]|uniref:Man(5)GlcNAc(2)-PP-dolichol translocation protein RFT1 n=1 Tax=Aulographum hederae CBS 113979 TaxID=1176131 RepID=A0A6G1GTQ8_9PEZI|nr:Rft-1-domain-containing protein [Aulographum hederae CBS 113979]